MVFDFMYCCNCYGYYHGLTYNKYGIRPSTSKHNKEADMQSEKRKSIVAEMVELQDQLLPLQTKLAELELVSLIGTEVMFNKYGVGIVVKQNENQITVRFGDLDKAFNIHRQYSQRPTFADDEQIVELFSDRYDTLKAIEKIENKIDNLKKQIDKLTE